MTPSRYPLPANPFSNIVLSVRPNSANGHEQCDNFRQQLFYRAGYTFSSHIPLRHMFNNFPSLPTFDFPPIFPLGAILFNFLFFTVAIPLEAYILSIRLKFDKRTSIFYAICINLFSGAIGWFAFFLLEPILPIEAKKELINYVFFNQFIANVHTLVFLTAVIIFFATFLIKFFLLKAALLSLREPSESKVEPEQTGTRKTTRRANKLKLQNTGLLTTTLIANSLSYSAISAIIVIQNFVGKG